MGTEPGYHGDRARVPWGQSPGTMGTEPGYHGDRARVPWGQSPGTMGTERYSTMGTEGYHGDRGVPWGQRGTMGTEGYLTMGTQGTLDSVDTSGNTTDAERVTWNHSSS